MQSFDRGFQKKAMLGKARLGEKILKGISTVAGGAAGAMLGGGLGLMTKGFTQDSFRDEKNDKLKDKALDYAPLAGTLAGALLGGRHAFKGWRKSAFDRGFAASAQAEKTAMSSGGLMLKNIWESTFHNAGESFGGHTGAVLGESIAASREKGIRERTLAAAMKDQRYEPSDEDSLDRMVGMTGVSDRANEVAAGAGMVLGALPLLRVAKPYTNARANLASRLVNQAQRAIQGPRFKPGLGNLALALGLGSFLTGIASSLAKPAMAESLGTLAARLRDKDIQKGVERYYGQKTASLSLVGFERAKTAASVIGVMPGVTSGLRTMASHGKVRMAKPVSGQSIGPRSVRSQVPSPVKPPNTGQPGGAAEAVRSTSVPQPSSYGSRLMGTWM